MVKFKYKKHIREDKSSGKVVIYYNIGDIFLGIALLLLIFFYIHFYLVTVLAVPQSQENTGSFANPFYSPQPTLKTTVPKTLPSKT